MRRRRRRRSLLERIKNNVPHKQNLNFRRKRHKFEMNKFQNVFLWCIEIILVILLAFSLTVAFGKRATCVGTSMEPTIGENHKVWLNRFSYMVSSPKIGDVIAFKPDGNTTASISMKRIMAGPKDSVLIQNGKLYVNQEVVKLEHSEQGIKDSGLASVEIVLGEDEYFVLGDNVNLSEDSRYSSVGNISKADIIGKVWFDLSLSQFGIVH